MANNIDNIAEVQVGSAAAFRETINNNFDEIKNSWTGLYVGPSTESTDANAKLKVGGLWIVTDEAINN